MHEAKHTATAARPRRFGHHVAPLRQTAGHRFFATAHTGLADGFRADGLPNAGQELDGGPSATQQAQLLHRLFVGEQLAIDTRLAQPPNGQRIPAPGTHLREGQMAQLLPRHHANAFAQKGTVLPLRLIGSQHRVALVRPQRRQCPPTGYACAGRAAGVIVGRTLCQGLVVVGSEEVERQG